MTRVLMLEDDNRLAEVVIRSLEERGHAVTRFRTVREARAAIPPVGFDVLLCDWELPDGTGADFLLDVDQASFLGLEQWTTILWSGLGRDRELDAAGVKVDHVLLKSSTVEALDLIEAAPRRQTERPSPSPPS